MEYVVLGSETAIPHPRRGSAGHLVRHAGLTLLVDAGTGTLQKLAVLGVPLAALDAVALTHFHPDHTAELAPLLFALRNPGLGRTGTLTLLGGAGLAEHYRRMRRFYGSWVEAADYPLRIEEVSRRPTSLGPLSLSAFPVAHAPESVAFRLEEAGTGRVLAISGDTDVCEGLVEAARDADVAVLECSFPEGRKVEGHLTPGEAGRLASRAGARRLVLTHFYPECEGEDLLGPCRRSYAGEVLLAEDLMRLSV